MTKIDEMRIIFSKFNYLKREFTLMDTSTDDSTKNYHTAEFLKTLLSFELGLRSLQKSLRMEDINEDEKTITSF